MNGSGAVHPFDDTLVFVGGAFVHEDDIAVFVGQIVPVGCAPTQVVDIEATVGNVRGQRSLGEEANPCVRGPTCALAVGVGDLGPVVKNDVLVRPRTADDAVEHGHRSGGGGIERSATHQFGPVEPAQGFAMDARSGNGA